MPEQKREYAKRRKRLPTLSTPGFKDPLAPELSDFSKLSPYTLGTGPSKVNKVISSKPLRPKKFRL
jgi:hypothetical protein